MFFGKNKGGVFIVQLGSWMLWAVDNGHTQDAFGGQHIANQHMLDVRTKVKTKVPIGELGPWAMGTPKMLLEVSMLST